MTETSLISILLVALGLSADCFAVTLAGSVSLKKTDIRIIGRTALAFGGFQAGMTLLGWALGSSVIYYIAAFDHWLAFGLLGFIGGKMIWESFHEDEKQEQKNAGITRWTVLLTLAVATSIDALAVGLSFAFLKVNIGLASGVIGGVAFIITVLGLMIGKKLGTIIGARAETIGGLILIGIGIKILIEHLM